jgi:hypothetical protein
MDRGTVVVRESCRWFAACFIMPPPRAVKPLCSSGSGGGTKFKTQSSPPRSILKRWSGTLDAVTLLPAPQSSIPNWPSKRSDFVSSRSAIALPHSTRSSVDPSSIRDSSSTIRRDKQTQGGSRTRLQVPWKDWFQPRFKLCAHEKLQPFLRKGATAVRRQRCSATSKSLLVGKMP